MYTLTRGVGARQNTAEGFGGGKPPDLMHMCKTPGPRVIGNKRPQTATHRRGLIVRPAGAAGSPHPSPAALNRLEIIRLGN